MSFVVTNVETGNSALFTWIPKTGGTSVFNALRACPALRVRNASPGHSQHALPTRATEPEALEVNFSFACVRHPVSWWESVFRFWRSQGWKDFEPGRWVPGRPLLACKSDDFATFMGNVVKREPGFCTRMFEWYCGPPLDSRLSVLRQESLRVDFSPVAACLDVDLRLGRDNVSPGPRVEWPADLLAEVRRLESPVIRRFYPEDAHE